MIQARRLGYAVLSAPDIGRQVAYFSEILGLRLIDRGATRAVLATPQGIECLVLESGAATALTGLAFQVAPTTDLDQACRTLGAAGLAAALRPGRTPGIDRILAFEDPGGIEIELFTQLRGVAGLGAGGGIGPLKIGHIARMVPDTAAFTAFYETMLGFRRSDWSGDSMMFMRCGPDHHTVNFFQGAARLNHIAFEVKDWSELARAADLLRGRGLPLDWGPARHHIGHNMACYHSNADGVRIELYCEMDRMLDEELGFWDPRPWHEDRVQRPKEWAAPPRNAWIPDAP